MAFPWAPVITGLAGVAQSLLGGLGRKTLSPRKQIALQKEFIQWQNSPGQQAHRLKGIVKGAEAAGFNPLTVLRGGGGAGFQQTHAPVLSGNEYASASVGDALAAGLGAGVQAAFDYDPLSEEKSQLELEIMRGQLRRINGGNAEYTRLGGAPAATGSRYRTSVPGTPVTNATLATGDEKEQGKRTVTNP